MCVDVFDTIVDVVEGNDGQYRAENFVGEQRRIARHIGNECGCNVALFAIGLTTINDGTVRKQRL